MAIYIGIKKIDEDDQIAYYSFFDCEYNEYGTLGLNKESLEITLLDSNSEGGEFFAFPRVASRINKLIGEKGISHIPENFAYQA